MQEFIAMATAVLGITEDAARKAAGGILDLFSRVAPASEFQQLLTLLPGAADLLRAVQPPPPPAPPPASPLAESLGSLVSNATMAVQGTVGVGMAFLNLASQVGFDPEKGRQFVVLFVDFARATAGAELVDRIVDAVPGFRTFVLQK